MTERASQIAGAAPLRWDLIDVYLSGGEPAATASQTEAARYVATDARAGAVVAWIQSGRALAGDPPPQGVAFAELAARLDLRLSGHRTATRASRGVPFASRRTGDLWTSRRPRQRGWFALTGAALAAAIIVGWRLGMGRPGPVASTYTTYVTGNGQRATILLPDGNTVALNVASRLEVPTDYSAGHHVVRLPHGEAFFTISHHAGTAFVVTSGGVATRVLGTSFIVRRYPTDTVATVAVHDGKVAVGAAVLAARQQVLVGRTGLSRVLPADASQFSFTSGVLTLNSMPLADAIQELDRWYDADIRLSDPALARRLVYGKFVAGSLADLTEVLAWTFAVRVVRTGRVLTLYPKAQ